MKLRFVLGVLLGASHFVTLYWNPAEPGSQTVITRIYRSRYSLGQCSTKYSRRFGTKKDTWTDLSIVAGGAYCYQARSYDKASGQESTEDNPTIIVEVPQ